MDQPFSEKLPELDRLSSYFHQDAFLDHETADEILQFYLRSESPDTVRRAIDELDQFLALQHDEETLKRITQADLYLEYIPESDGWPSIEDWLQHVRDVISSANEQRRSDY